MSVTTMAEKSFVIKFLIYVIESFEYGITNKYGLHAYIYIHTHNTYSRLPAGTHTQNTHPMA